MDQRPIIVFDSGFGGISVLKKLVDMLPNEHFLYFGDSANAPYGPRPTSEVCALTLRAIASQMERHPKAIVIACNTATAAAGEMLAAVYPEIPVIGIKPAVQAAVDAGNQRVLVLATAGTLSSETFARQLEQLEGDAVVVPIPAPGIVEYVEGEMKERAKVLSYLRDLIKPDENPHYDAVVLGCTHFPFAADAIAEALGYEVRFYDGSSLTAAQTAEALRKNGTANTGARSGSVQIINSADRLDMLHFAWKLFSL